jgi:hypothetical protein
MPRIAFSPIGCHSGNRRIAHGWQVLSFTLKVGYRFRRFLSLDLAEL